MCSGSGVPRKEVPCWDPVLRRSADSKPGRAEHLVLRLDGEVAGVAASEPRLRGLVPAVEALEGAGERQDAT